MNKINLDESQVPLEVFVSYIAKEETLLFHGEINLFVNATSKKPPEMNDMDVL